MSDTSNAHPSTRYSVQPSDMLIVPPGATPGRTRPSDKDAAYHQLLKDIREDVRAMGATKIRVQELVEDTRSFVQETVEDTRRFVLETVDETKSSIRGLKDEMAALSKTIEDSIQNEKDFIGEMSEKVSHIEANMAQVMVDTKQTLVLTKETRQQVELLRKDMESENDSRMVEEVKAAIFSDATLQRTMEALVAAIAHEGGEHNV